MKTTYTHILKGSFLQYARSYAYLITIAATIGMASLIIPSPSAAYTTLSFGSYSMEYNSAYIGLVSAIISSIFLSLVGYFLISGSMKKDIDSGVAQLIGTSRISNLGFLISKVLSNFVVLMSMLAIILIVSIGLFFFYSTGESFKLLQFLLPFLFITTPALFFISCIAILLEVFLPRSRRLQYLLFFGIFMLTLLGPSIGNYSAADMYGVQYPVEQLTEQFRMAYPQVNLNLNIGITPGRRDVEKMIAIEAISYPFLFIGHRLVWILYGLLLIILASLKFRRFDLKKEAGPITLGNNGHLKTSSDFRFEGINETVSADYGVKSLFYAELIMMIRKSKKGMSIVFLGGMIAMFFLPLHVSHCYLVPVLWFVQVVLWSDLTTKDALLRTDYLALTSVQPKKRILISRIASALVLALVITLPLMLRYLFILDLLSCLNLALGAVFIVLLSVLLGKISKTSKLFEVIFFFIVYANINKVPILDYFGSMHHSISYTLLLALITLLCFPVLIFLSSRYVR